MSEGLRLHRTAIIAASSVERVIGVGLVEDLLAVVAAVAVGVRLVRVRAVDVDLVIIEQPVVVGVGAVRLLALRSLVVGRPQMRRMVERLGARVDLLPLPSLTRSPSVRGCSGGSDRR
jgi:hypothetical protein